MHVLDAVRWLISLQTAFCIAPYRIRDRRLVCSAATTGWTVVGALLFVAVVAYSAVRAYAEHSMELRFRNGYLWGIIATFEFSFTNFAYPALVVHSLRHRRDPIAFYNGIADMDAQLRRELGVRTGPLNRRLHRIIMWFIGLSFPFFNCLWAALLLLFALNGLQLGMGVLLFVCANQLEQLTMGLLTWSLVSHLLVMRARFRALRTVRLNGGGAGGRLSAGASTVARTRRRVAVWLSAFQRLVGMLDRLSVGVGNVVALRFTHDFTLLLSQVYLVYWLVADYRRQHLATIVFVAFWSVPNVLKIGATTYAAHVTVEEVIDWAIGVEGRTYVTCRPCGMWNWLMACPVLSVVVL